MSMIVAGKGPSGTRLSSMAVCATGRLVGRRGSWTLSRGHVSQDHGRDGWNE